MLPQLRSYLLDNWSELPLAGPRPRDLTFLVQATGVTKLCCFIFADGAAQPRWVAKMARSPRDNALIAGEYRLIQHLRRHGSDFVRESVPGPLLTTHVAGHLVAIEAYLSGRPMDGLLSNSTGQGDQEARRHLDMALDWLLRTQQETSIQRGRLTGQQVQTFLLAPLEQLKATGRLTAAEIAYLDRLAEHVTRLPDCPLPLVFYHGDFRPGNILVESNSMKVIDWEFGAAKALPLMDVFNILTRMHARHRGLEEIDGYLEDYLEAFEALFFEDGPLAELVGRCVDRACRALDIDPAWTGILFSLFLVTEANKYHAFLSRRAARGYLYLLRSRNLRLSGPYADQLARQKNVWLLGHLAQNEERLIFRRFGSATRRQPAAWWQTAGQVA